MTKSHKAAIIDFQASVEEYCMWPGTEWVGTGKEARVIECGDTVIGKGVFCDPSHSRCRAIDVCERHKGTLPWYGEEDFWYDPI